LDFRRGGTRRQIGGKQQNGLVGIKNFQKAMNKALFKGSTLKTQILNIPGLQGFPGHNDKVGHIQHGALAGCTK
jgi:hypothetical protein